ATVWALTCAVAGSFGVILAISRAVDDLPRSAAAAARILEIAGATDSADEWPESRYESLPASLDIVLRNVSVDFGRGGGLRGVDLTVAQGTHLFVAGRSGVGKSTLARLVLGLERPDSGRVLLGRTSLEAYRETELRSVLSAAMQRAGLVRGSVLENVAVGSRRGLGRDDDLPKRLTSAERRVADGVAGFARLCEDLSLGEETRVGGAHEELSGGQQRRVAIARMVVRDPSIVVLDEAFAGLDNAGARDLRDAVVSWARREGRTVIEISHELEHAFDADRVIVIEEGRVVEDGTPESLVNGDGVFAALINERLDASLAGDDLRSGETELK
ncbi:MAG: ATP-binding cassette domain-containing protein, partial [bacterium]